MKNIIFIIITFTHFSSNVSAENTIIKSGKYLTKTLEKIIPLNLFKEVGKKVTKFGSKELLLGAAASGIIAKGLTDDDNNNKNIIQANNLIKVKAQGQINLDEIDENLAKRRALEDALYFASMKAGAEVKGFSSIDEKTIIK